MDQINPSMRLKVNRDTFFIPDGNRGVYFRNNVSSFRMDGSTIAEWIDMLLPMFTGKYSLEEMTSGLPVPHRRQVFNIAEVLLKNGFVRDVSLDRPHRLSEMILESYASQIEFIDHFVGSGAYRFQIFRQSKVLVIGSGASLQSLLSSLTKSGLEKIHFLISESSSVKRKRIEELTAFAQNKDTDLLVEEIQFDTDWKTTIQPFDYILSIAGNDKVDELRKLHFICRHEKKIFIPAVFLNNIGFAGPVVKPNSEGCWESAWRSVHLPGEKSNTTESDLNIAGALMANLLVFELFKEITGVNEQKRHSEFYLLNSETLEGGWHAFIPHPLVTGSIQASWEEDLDSRIKEQSLNRDAKHWFRFFSQLTSAQSGIFHKWEEGDLKQLPLAQCSVQSIDLLSDGPAQLLPEMIISDLTHMEARRQAGLTGAEMYVQRAISELFEEQPNENVTVGAGETVEEAICRGLQKYLENEFWIKHSNLRNVIKEIKIQSIEDEKSKFYWQSLKTMFDESVIGLGEAFFGFPVVWVGTRKGWVASPGLNMTAALRNALQQAVMLEQNQTASNTLMPPVWEKTNAPKNVSIHAEARQREVLISAKNTLKDNGQTLLTLHIQLQPFVEPFIKVYGVLLREEEL